MALSVNAIAQQNPTGTAPTPGVTPPNLPSTINQTERAWYRGGNQQGGSAGNNNVFGTMWNSPVYHYTTGKQRMVVNGDRVVGINGFNGQVTDGFVGIGANTTAQGFPFNGTNAGPFSLLHLNSGVGAFVQSSGWRPWMKYGITSTHNQDLMFMGQRATGGPDVTDAVIGWADNAYSGAGPDNMVFNFLAGTSGGTDDLAGTANFGREIMRLTAIGNVGIGPRFNNNSQPQSQLHINGENAVPTYLEITNQSSTGQTAGDGFHIGIATNGVAEVNQKENLDLRFFTNNTQQAVIKNTGWIGFNTNTPGNELEITSRAAAPYGLAGSGLRFTNMKSTATPITNPGTGVLSVDANGDVIYVPGGSGSATGNNGINFDLATNAVQLGGTCGNLKEMLNSALQTDRTILMADHNFWFANLNTDAGGVGVGGQPSSTPFCNVGNTFEISANMKNVKYGNTNASGLRFSKLTSSSPVLADGTNGVDNTKVLTVDGDGDVVLVNCGGSGTANANNGLLVSSGNVQLGGDCSNATEIATAKLLSNRFIAMNNKNIIWSEGRTGFGTGGCTPGNRVEIQGFSSNQSGLRFTNITATSIPAINQGQGLLSVDANGDVVYVQGSFGAPCSAPTPYQLPTNWRVDLNNKSLNFNGAGNINIGDLNGCQTLTPGFARLFVRNTYNNLNIPQIGIEVANWGTAATGNYAVQTNGDINVNGFGYYTGGILVASDKNIKQNIDKITTPLDIIEKLQPVRFNYNNSYAPQLNVDNGNNYGFIAQEVEQVIPELVKQIKVHGRIDSTGTAMDSTATLKTLNYVGLIPFAIGGIQELNAKQREMQARLDKGGLSDAQVKTNINNFNALAKIKTLNPVSYNFTNQNVPQLSFKNNLDYGFVAQQLQTVYPELIDTINIAATYDSLGNVANQAKTLKTVNYKAMAALLTRAIQEQQLTIDSLKTVQSKQDSINQATQTQLNQLMTMITECCNNSHGNNGNHNGQRTNNINQLDVELSDKDAVVLNQNVPNPFAEQTTITYNIPTSVGKAQIIFYSANGQIIQTVDVKSRGKGKVNVFASDLSSGLYHYTLVADGKVVDSKKMVRE